MTTREAVERLLARPLPWPMVTAGAPVLRQTAQSYCGEFDDLLPGLISGMRTTMRAAPGVGLAAPQVGLGIALAVLEDPGTSPELAVAREREPYPFRVLVNPAYEPVGTERVTFYEGCLSVPGYQAATPRWRSVRLTGFDEHRRELDEVLTGWPARIVQHETDHLAGLLYLDGAHLRSLADEAHIDWLREGRPEAAARALGFPLGEIPDSGS